MNNKAHGGAKVPPKRSSFPRRTNEYLALTCSVHEHTDSEPSSIRRTVVSGPSRKTDSQRVLESPRNNSGRYFPGKCSPTLLKTSHQF